MSETTPDPRIKRIEEDGIVFPLLTLDQIQEVEEVIKKSLLAHQVMIAKATDLQPAEAFTLINNNLPEQIDINDIAKWAHTAAGMRFVLVKSIGDKPDVLANYAGTNGANMAMAILGFAKRMTPIEVENQLLDVTKRLNGLHQREAELAERRAALEAEERELDGNEPEKVEEPKSSPPGGEGASS